MALCRSLGYVDSLTLSIRDWQVYHREQLERMQKESLRLQSNHHARLKGIEKHLLQIKKDVFVLQKPIDGGTWTRINALQKQMATVVDSNNEVSRQHAILQSLTFPARPVRHDSLSEAHSKTYQWMFAETSTEAPDSAEGSFLRWLRQGSGIFWFSGKAGSGKSTLVKFVADDRRTLAALRRWARPAEVVIASHYFWAAGSAIQRSQQGLLQTLLFDIFRQVPGLAKLTCPDRWSDCLGSLSPAWSLAELHNTLRQVARVTLDSDVAGADATSVKFCIFIDGADEYEGDQLELCDAIKELSQFPCFKLCISSRPWNVFEDAFGANEAQKINLHELTNQDIRQYAESRLQQHPRWARVASSAMAADCQELLDQITERSSGVFLWVVLVTNLLREGLTNDDSLSDLRRRLESFPVELEPFFKSMLDSVERFYYEKMATTFRMATHAKGPLHWMMYAFHDMEYEDSDYSLNLPPESFAEGDVKEMEAQTARRLNGRSRGLLEIDVKGDVNVLHRTVMDFLRTQEIADFLVENSPPWFVPERSVLKAHAALLKVQDWRYPRSVSRRDPIPTAAASQCLVFSRLNLANFINISGLCVIILGIAFWMS